MEINYARGFGDFRGVAGPGVEIVRKLTIKAGKLSLSESLK